MLGASAEQGGAQRCKRKAGSKKKSKKSKKSKKLKNEQKSAHRWSRIQSRLDGSYLSFESDKLSTKKHVLDNELFSVGSKGSLLNSAGCDTGLTVQRDKSSGGFCTIHNQHGLLLSVVRERGCRFVAPGANQLETAFQFETFLSPKLPGRHLQELCKRGWTLVPLLSPARASHVKASVSACEDAEYGADVEEALQKRSLQVATAESAGEGEAFTILDNPGGTVSVRTHFGTFLSAGRGGSVLQQLHNNSNNEKFHLTQEHAGNKVSLQTTHGNFLSAKVGGKVGQRASKKEGEIFSVHRCSAFSAPSNKSNTTKCGYANVSLETAYGRFLSVRRGERKLQQRVGDIGVRDSDVLRVAADPILTGLLRQYLGNEMRCATFSSNTLLRQIEPGEETGAIWHVDYPYKNDRSWVGSSAQTRPLGAQVLVCLDEFTSVNGGTMFYSNTHELGAPPMKPAGAWEACDKYGTPAPTPQARLREQICGQNSAGIDQARSQCQSQNQISDKQQQQPEGKGKGKEKTEKAEKAVAVCRCEQLGRAPTAAETRDCEERGFCDVLAEHVRRYHPCPAGSVLVAHSAWWHRQVRNYAASGPGAGIASHHPNRRTALLANFTRAHVPPMKGATAMEEEYASIKKQGWFDKDLTSRERRVIQELWIGEDCACRWQ